MNYEDGILVEPGDVVRIDRRDRGRVVASMDTGKYLPENESWAYLGEGIMVETDFAGLVNYTTQTAATIELLERPPSPG
jgi:hypothetical protein